MNEIREIAPAKLNLVLDIVRKRPDGFHDLDMVMQSISLCDIVTVRETGEGFRLCAGFLPDGKKSLEQRAAEAFFQYLDRPMPGLEVELDKQIPAYAGMGGGSSDVAAVLRALRAMYAPELSDQVLQELGLTVGSDVPFCVRGGTMLARGRGEQLQALPAMPACWILICKPPFDLPTPALFGRVKVDSLSHSADPEQVAAALHAGDLAGVAGALANAFEEVLTEEEGQAIREIKETMLHAGALNACMTGSGPTVFGIFREKAEAEAAENVLKQTYQAVFLAQPMEGCGKPV